MKPVPRSLELFAAFTKRGRGLFSDITINYAGETLTKALSALLMARTPFCLEP